MKLWNLLGCIISPRIYLVRNDFRKENDMIPNAINVYRKSYIFSVKALSSLSIFSEHQNISSSASSQSEINSNTTVTSLLFSVTPQNASENSESPFWGISRKKTVWFVICQNTISLINQVRHLSHSLPPGARHEKKWRRFRSNREEFLFRKETLSRRFFPKLSH